MELVGINLSDSSIEAVEIQQGFIGLPAIQAISRVVLPDQCVENGIIRNLPVLVEKMQHVLATARPRPITTTTVALALPETQVFSRLLSFPLDVTSEQMQATITDQFSRYLPFELSDVVHDHLTLGKRGAYHDVLLVAVQRSVLTTYQELAEQLHWRVAAFELESISSARAVLSDIPVGETVLLLDVGARTTIASWFDHQSLRYTFNTPLAGNYFTQQVVEQLHVPFADAEQKKCQSGVAHAPVADIVQHAWQPLLKHVSDGITYVQTKLELPTSRIVLIGGSAQLPGISEWLTAQLHHPVVLPSLLPGLKKNDMVQLIQQEGSLYYNAVGLALGATKAHHQRPRINFNKSIK